MAREPSIYHLKHVFYLPISFHRSSIMRSMLEFPPLYISNNAFYSFMSTKHTIIQYESTMQHRITHVFQKCAIYCWFKKHRYIWHIDIYGTSNSSPNNKKTECLPKTLVCGLIGLQIGERINVPICRQHPFKHWLPNFECWCANELKRFYAPWKMYP